MEQSDPQHQILRLGKVLVQELEQDSGVDTFSRWMAHYIAEKITLAEQSPPGKKKQEAEKECFDTILKLWEHRWLLPYGKQPLRNFEPILKTLQKLDPDAGEPYFYHSLDHDLSTLEKENPGLTDIMSYTKMASQVDKTARILIDDLFHQAALKATNEKTNTILNNAVSLPHNADARVIRVIARHISSTEKEPNNPDDIEKKWQTEKISQRIKDLETFSRLHTSLLDSYKKELAALEVK